MIKCPKSTILVSMVITSQYIKIVQEEDITTACEALRRILSQKPSVPTRYQGLSDPSRKLVSIQWKKLSPWKPVEQRGG